MQLCTTAVWLNGGSSGKLNVSNFNKHLCLVYSEVLISPPLRQATKSYAKLSVTPF